MKNYKVLSGAFAYEARVYASIDDAENITLSEWESEGKPHVFTPVASYTSPTGAQYKGLYDHGRGSKAIVKLDDNGDMVLLECGCGVLLIHSGEVGLVLVESDGTFKFYVESLDY